PGVAGAVDERALHPFPTRRSSDLCRVALVCARAVGRGDAGAQPARIRRTGVAALVRGGRRAARAGAALARGAAARARARAAGRRSEEHTSELQSQSNLVCRLLLEK